MIKMRPSWAWLAKSDFPGVLICHALWEDNGLFVLMAGVARLGHWVMSLEQHLPVLQPQASDLIQRLLHKVG